MLPRSLKPAFPIPICPSVHCHHPHHGTTALSPRRCHQAPISHTCCQGPLPEALYLGVITYTCPSAGTPSALPLGSVPQTLTALHLLSSVLMSKDTCPTSSPPQPPLPALPGTSKRLVLCFSYRPHHICCHHVPRTAGQKVFPWSIWMHWSRCGCPSTKPLGGIPWLVLRASGW